MKYKKHGALTVITTAVGIFLGACSVTTKVESGAWVTIKLKPGHEGEITDSASLISKLGVTGLTPAQVAVSVLDSGEIRACTSVTTTINFNTDIIENLFKGSKPNPGNPQNPLQVSLPNFSLPSSSTLRVENTASSVSLYVGTIYINDVAVTTGSLTIAGGAYHDYTIPSSIAITGNNYYELKVTHGANSSSTYTTVVGVYVSLSKPFRSGDVTSNGTVDISDPIAIQSYLFSGGSPPPCLEAADANNDDVLDVSDSVYLLAYLFSGGSAPLPGPVGTCSREVSPGLSCYDNGTCLE